MYNVTLESNPASNLINFLKAVIKSTPVEELI